MMVGERLKRSQPDSIRKSPYWMQGLPTRVNLTPVKFNLPSSFFFLLSSPLHLFLLVKCRSFFDILYLLSTEILNTVNRGYCGTKRVIFQFSAWAEFEILFKKFFNYSIQLFIYLFQLFTYLFQLFMYRILFLRFPKSLVI